MSSKKKVIDKEFKINAVKYKEEHPDLTCEDVASNLGISTSSLYRWVNEFASADDKSNVFRGSSNFSSDEAKEIARLKKKTETLRMLLKY